MPSSTAGKALPYPLGSDRLMDGDDQIRKLAQSVDNMVQIGRVTIPITAAGTAVSVTWNFPVPFANTPTVVATIIGGVGIAQNIPSVTIVSISATQTVVAGCRQTGTAALDAFVMAVGPVTAVA